ncbi:exosome catalytic subunit dis3 [Irineochytrium annulatum]|nr:exosome catalytic subunit dis3 [Irineochytrium annulatum]
MLFSKGFVRKTRRGTVVKILKEHYLREDIFCGVIGCQKCAQVPVLESRPTPPSKSSKKAFATTSHFLIPDTNVFFHQIDLLSHEAFRNVIVLQTVLNELKHRSASIYARVRALVADPTRKFWVFSNECHRETYVEAEKGETPNDRNDRAIRVACSWYMTHLPGPTSVVLLSDDADNRRKAAVLQIVAASVREYAECMEKHPELSDMVSIYEDEAVEGGKRFKYAEHLTPSQISAGLKSGAFLQGTLNISTYNFLEGSLMTTLQGEETRILVLGRENLNRGVNGDVVAIQLLPISEWPKTDAGVAVDEDEEDDEGDASTTKMQADKRPLKPSTTDDFSAGEPKPAARIVGIIKRNWRPYCGTIEPPKGATGGHQSVFFWPMDKRVPKIRIRTRQVASLTGRRIIVAIDSWSKDSRYPSGHFVRNVGEVGEKTTETDVLLLEHSVPFAPFSKQVMKCLPLEGEAWVVTNDHLPGRVDLRGLTEVTPDAQVVDCKFSKSVIRSAASLTYDEAQARLDDPYVNLLCHLAKMFKSKLKDEVSTSIRILNTLAKKFRARRIEGGALVLASPEVRFTLDNDAQDAVDVELKEMKETNALVEEFMLLANIYVAKKIYSMFPDSSVLRRHPKPPATNFESLIKAASTKGITIDPSSNETLAASLDNAIFVKLPEEPYFNKLMRIMTTRHYGLASEIYTHFTSPIRRYADLQVHRLLAACIGYDKIYSSELVDKVKVSELCDGLNYRNRMAQQAARSSVELYTNLFFKSKKIEEPAFITRVLKNGFIGIIYSGPNADFNVLEYNSTNETLVHRASKTVFAIFGKVKVKVEVQEAGHVSQRSKLVLRLLEPHIPGLNVD